MRASRTHGSRLIMFHSPDLTFDGASALRKQIVDFVRGIRGERKNAVTEKQIVQWFRGTNAAFVRRQIGAACAAGEIRCCAKSLGSHRSHAGAYVYEVSK